MTGTESTNPGGGFDLLRRATQAMMSRFVNSFSFVVCVLSCSALQPFVLSFAFSHCTISQSTLHLPCGPKLGLTIHYHDWGLVSLRTAGSSSLLQRLDPLLSLKCPNTRCLQLMGGDEYGGLLNLSSGASATQEAPLSSQNPMQAGFTGSQFTARNMSDVLRPI